MVVKTYKSIQEVLLEIADEQSLCTDKWGGNARIVAASNVVNGLLVSGLLVPVYNEAEQKVQWELSTVADLVGIQHDVSNQHVITYTADNTKAG